MPDGPEKLSGQLKISLWPEGYGLLKESCLKNKQKKKTSKQNKQEEFFELSSSQGEDDSGMSCFFDGTSCLSQQLYLNSHFLDSGEESNIQERVSLLTGPSPLHSACCADSLSPLSSGLRCQSLPGCL